MTRKLGSLLALATVSLCLGCDPPPEVGQLVVLAPGEPVSFSVDGGAAQDAKTVKLVDLTPGEHTIAFTKPAPHEAKFTIKRNQKTVVPTRKNQCYIAMWVTSSHYADEQGNRLGDGAPKFQFLEVQSQPFAPPGSHYFQESDLPETISVNTPAGMYVSGTCKELIAIEEAHKAAQG